MHRRGCRRRGGRAGSRPRAPPGAASRPAPRWLPGSRGRWRTAGCRARGCAGSSAASSRRVRCPAAAARVAHVPRRSGADARSRASRWSSTPWARSSSSSSSSACATHDQRQATGQAHGLDVLAAGDVEGMLPQHAVARGHQHHRFGRRTGAFTADPSVGSRPCRPPAPACATACRRGRDDDGCARRCRSARHRPRRPRPPVCPPDRSMPSRAPRSLAGSRRWPTAALRAVHALERRPKSGARFIEMSTKPPQGVLHLRILQCGKLRHAALACSPPGSSAWRCCS